MVKVRFPFRVVWYNPDPKKVKYIVTFDEKMSGGKWVSHGKVPTISLKEARVWKKNFAMEKQISNLQIKKVK